MLRSRWTPWPDVEIITWLVPAWPWHVRVHRVRTARALRTAEGGFAIRYSPEARASLGADWRTGGGFAIVPEAGECSGVRDLLAARMGENLVADPNSSLMSPSAVIPMLRVDLSAGEHWLGTAVLGHRGADGASLFEEPPLLDLDSGGFTVTFRAWSWRSF